MSFNTNLLLSVISCFRHDIEEISSLLGYYGASSGNTLPTFRDKVSVISSRVKKSMKFSSWTCVGIAFQSMLLKEEVKGRRERRSKQLLDDLTNREDTGN